MSIKCCMFIPAYMPHVQLGSGTWWDFDSQNSAAADPIAAARIERRSPA